MGVQVSSQLQGLEESFQAFNQLSESLETTYQCLEDRVAQLQFQLIELQRKQNTHYEDQDQLSRHLSNILQAIPAGVVVLSASGKVKECNQAATNLLGGPLREEVWLDVVSRAFAPRSDDGYETSLRDGRRVSIATCPLLDDPGQVLLLNDVTETRRLQEQLSQHQRLTAMGEMAAGLAHQIRTPLSSALLCGSQLKSNKLDAITRSMLVDKVLDHMRSLEGLVNDMLLFSRSGFGGDDPVSIKQLCQDLERSMEQQLADSNASLIINNQVGESTIIGNQTILQSALQNLITNSIQAAGKGVRLNIDVRSTLTNSIDILVSDDGPGIKPEIVDQIFEPFFTTRSNGTGLGLAVVRAIVRAHHGEIWLEDNTPTGCSFIVRLPAKQDFHEKLV